MPLELLKICRYVYITLFEKGDGGHESPIGGEKRGK